MLRFLLIPGKVEIKERFPLLPAGSDNSHGLKERQKSVYSNSKNRFIALPKSPMVHIIQVFLPRLLPGCPRLLQDILPQFPDGILHIRQLGGAIGQDVPDNSVYFLILFLPFQTLYGLCNNLLPLPLYLSHLQLIIQQQQKRPYLTVLCPFQQLSEMQDSLFPFLLALLLGLSELGPNL